ncbi:MAG: hypothetical protein AMS25_06550 [Gemmatimonas sp. SM23_52]|nr:MAG: hypothetical protein AMS25_06550 [Gemmatimonas sp. SM23_52]
MKLGKAILALVLATTLAGCDGGEPTAPVSAINDGGTGNQSLLVLATVDVDEVTGGFLTEFQITVSDRDAEPVSGADVSIEGDFATLDVQETGTAGFYRAELSGAASGALRLRVQKDTLYVRGVVLGNIGIHAILEPQAHDTVPANQPLFVRWVSDREAPYARLTTRDAVFEDLPDQGEFLVPGDQNPPRSNQRYQLLRYNEVQISGGLRGSYFRMDVWRTVEPVVVQAP